MPQIVEVPEGTILLTTEGIPAGAQSRTKCCGNLIADTNGPADFKAKCPTCKTEWTVVRERMS